ncbi:MAG: AI-2E family transporter [Christensenellaceae bacterium]|nr:AI-2E family transporter [Christensenellaceae bacterium]
MNLTPRNIRKLIFIVCFGILFFVLLTNINIVWTVLRKIISILSPIIVGCCIAFVLNVVMRLFDNILFKPMDRSRFKLIRKTKRPLSLICSMLFVAGILTLAVLVIFPQIEDALTDLVKMLPAYAADLLQWVKDVMISLNLPAEQIQEISTDWTQLIAFLQNFAATSSSGSLLDSAVNIAGSLVGVVVNLILGLFIASYILVKKERIADLAQKAGRAFIKEEKRYLRVERVVKMTSSAFTNFVTGQCLEAIILGVLCFIGMLIFGFPYAAVVSVLVGITALVPIFGAWIGGGISALLILMVDPLKALLFAVFLFILQQLEGNLIYPRVVGKTVGLPGLLVLIAVIIGEKVGGILGMLAAVPVASICYALFKEAIDMRLQRKERKNSRMQTESQESPEHTESS